LAQVGVFFTPYAWAGHVLIAAAMQALIALTLTAARVRQAWWLGSAVAIGYAWSREKTEYEFALKYAAHGRSVGPYWYRGFLPLEWDAASQWQFYAPAIAVILIAWAAERRGRVRS
jgi:hypothetical protein